MRILLDTNVFISGTFFTGPPYQILKAWHDGRVQLVVSPSILDEYQRIGAELALRFDDPSDDKFLEAALAGKAPCIVGGDKHLLKLSVFQGIQILKPRNFVQRYLR